MVFTNWTDLETKMKNDLASGAWTVASYTTSGGRTMQYRSFSEFMQAYHFVKSEAAAERGEISLRTYATTGGVGL